MSMWTYIKGVITVEPLGRTPTESRYVLESVLHHLPIVFGSEINMSVNIIENGSNSSCSHDEYENKYECYDLDGRWVRGGFPGGSEYLLVVDGSLRDTEFEPTYKSFVKWLTRLSKRVWVNDVLVKIYDPYGNSSIINDKRWIDLWQDKGMPYSTWKDNDIEENWCNKLLPYRREWGNSNEN